MSAAPRPTLEDKLRAGPLTPDESVRIIWALCDRFEKHSKAETLGDVTPARITVFGRLVEAQVPDAQPVPGFSAPERGSSGPTPRSDVYSVGSVLAFLLLGRPWEAGAALPTSATHLGPVINKCLATDPGARYASLADLKRALVRLDKTLISGPTTTSGPLPNTSLGPWQLEGLLGQGSMGHVYRAKHQALGRLAAIKVLRPEQYQNPELVQRFFQEARTVNQINHEHIVEISDFAQEDGPTGPTAVYCVMEFLQGHTLGDELEAGPMPLARGLRVVEQVADALSAAHRVGVVHRDVKPDNIMLIERGGSRDYVKVLDFGVAKLTDTDGKAMMATTEGAIIGTPICMSPEQAQGDEIDARSDVWAVGVILYRLLTGRFPFDAPTFVNIAVQIITKPYAPLGPKSVSGEVIPEALATLVERCLQKRRDLRPASMDEVRDTLHLILTPPAAAPRPKWPWALGAVALIGAAVGAGVFFKPEPTSELPPIVVVLPPLVADASAVEPGIDAGVTPALIAAIDAGSAAVDAGVADDEPVDAGVRKVRPPKPVKLTPKIVSDVFRDASRTLQDCVTKSQQELSPTGKVVVTLTVRTTGVPKDVGAKAESPRLEACVRKVVEKLRFPPNVGPERPMGYTVPYVLK